MISFILNCTLACVCLFLAPTPSLGVFAAGFAGGFLFIALFAHVLGARNYVRRATALGKFALAFAKEFLAANFRVAKLILGRNPSGIRPNFVAYDIGALTQTEAVLLAHCITLTPGTTAVSVEETRMVIHALDAPDPETLRRDIDRTLTRPILEFMR